jgi:hypothetical protein
MRKMLMSRLFSCRGLPTLPWSLVGVGVLGLVAACTKKAPAPPTPLSPSAGAEAGAGAAEGPGSVAIHDAGAAIEDASLGPLIYGLYPQTPIMSDMDWPIREDARRDTRGPQRKGAVRVGYLRQGGTAVVVPEAHPKANCPDGWYELVSGGFVCARYATLDSNHPRVRMAPHAPYLDQPLPYEYGYNITNGTPLYKTAPSREDRLKFEPWLKPRARVKPLPVADEANPYAEMADAGHRRRLPSNRIRRPRRGKRQPQATPGWGESFQEVLPQLHVGRGESLGARRRPRSAAKVRRVDSETSRDSSSSRSRFFGFCCPDLWPKRESSVDERCFRG